LLGVAGALTAAILGARFGRIAPLTVGILGGIVPLMFLFGPIGAWIYAIAVCVYNYAWNLTHPFLVASMASFDRSGRMVVYAVACQMLGLANGPWIAARVINEGDYSNVLWLGMGLFALALVLIVPPIVNHRNRLVTVAA
jgi:predicted MFS family arabinose efflux permease